MVENTHKRIDTKVESTVDALTAAVDRAEENTGHRLTITELPFAVGYDDGTGPVTRFATLAEAEAEIWRLEGIDPVGVHAGNYFIDGPEELINPKREHIDITPESLRAPEGVAHVMKAQNEWDDATHNLANYLKNVVDDIFYTDGDKIARAEYYSELQTLIGIREAKQEAFLKALASH
jgi:hypothetical protein